jgi:DNA-binding ferritin-like protein
MKDMSECLARLLAYVSNVHVAHWLANTVTNEHKVLGDVYDGMEGLTDDFAEVYMGKYGVISFPEDGKIEDITAAPITKGLEIVAHVQSMFEAGTDDDLLNIIADMMSLLNKSKYLLKESVGKSPSEKYPKVADAISRKIEQEDDDKEEE